jgi:hypothetical protein
MDNVLKINFPLSKNKVLILSDKSPDFFSIALANINILILHQSKDLLLQA